MNTRNSGKRTLMLVSYSANNADGTYSLTYNNHIRYCRRNNYSYMAVNESYSMFTNIRRIKTLLSEFDIVFTCDSDIVFTDMNRRVEEFAGNYVSVCVEQWCDVQYSLCNGGFLIFSRKDDGVFEYLDKFEKFSSECAKRRNEGNVKCIYGDNKTSYYMPTHAEYGTQSVFNLAVIDKKQEILSGMALIPSGSLQSYLPEYLHYCNGSMRQDATWNKEKYLIHLIGLKPNHPAFKSKADVISDFLTKFPEYR